MAMMRLDPRTNAGAAVLFSRSRMAMDLASAAVRDGMKAELEIATALAESLPPVRHGKIECALTDDFAELIANDPCGCMCRPNECARGRAVEAGDCNIFRHFIALRRKRCE